MANFFPLSLKTIPGVFAKVISAQLPSPSKEVNYCIEGGIMVCGDAVLLDFWCGFAVIFIFSCGIAVLQNQAVCGI